MARSLAHLYPTLHFVVQVSNPAPLSSSLIANGLDFNTSPREREQEPELELNPRITITNRIVGTRQTATDAAIYILHLPTSSPGTMLEEMQVHLGVLRASNAVMLILTARLLPEPGTIPDPAIEAIARSRSLTLRQLTNEYEMEMVELLEMIGTVRDNRGKLVVTNKLRSRNDLVVALVVKYQVYQSE